MKQAILITAYKEINSIIDLIDFFGSNFNYYIHIDKKSKIDFSILCNKSNVYLTDKYTVNWGGLNHLKSILLLSNEALKNADNSFFHLITGEDFPTKTIDDFINLDISKNYVEYFEMPAACWIEDNGGFDRIDYYQLYDVFNAKNEKERSVINWLLRIQNKLKIKRSYSNQFPSKLYGGSSYWSLTRNALQYVINYTNENREFLERFRFTFCSEEIYFHTLLLNSPHATNIMNNNLRYIDWSAGGDSPAYLDENDFDRIIASEKYFARKIAANEKLKFLLTTYLQKQGNKLL